MQFIFQYPDVPALLAKSAATVDKLSNGRYSLGAGTGYLKAEYVALGVDFDERNALFDETLDVLPLRWSGRPFDVSTSDDLRARLTQLKDLAGDRFAQLDIAVAYTDSTVHDTTTDVQRHQDELGALEALGATWVIVPGPTDPHPRALEFVQAFGSTYLAGAQA